MTGFIYKITSPKARIYIGQSINIKQRISSYRNGFCKNQPRLHRSIKKHGWENHLFEIIEECELSILDEREVFYISKYKTFDTPHGLNLTSGGKSNSKHAKQVIKKLIRLSTGRVVSLETKEKLRQYNLGKKQSEETIKKRTKLLRGLKRTDETKKRISEGRKGIKFSEDHIHKLKIAIRHPITDQQRLKMSLSFNQKSIAHNYGSKRKCKKVINTLTGEIFDCLEDIAKENGINSHLLRAWLRGKGLNETYFAWLDSEDINRNVWDVLGAKNKIILNTETGIYYDQIKRAAKAHNIHIVTLRNYLTKIIKNKTQLIYV